MVALGVLDDNVLIHLLTYSHPKLVYLVCGMAATWRSACIHQMNRVNSRKGLS